MTTHDNILEFGELTEHIKKHAIIDSEYFNEFVWINGNITTTEFDRIFNKTKNIVIRNYDFYKKIKGVITNDNFIQYTIDGSQHDITGIEFSNSILNNDIDNISILFHSYNKKFYRNHCIVLQHIGNFSQNELPFIPLKFGLKSREKIFIIIKLMTNNANEFINDYSYINVKYKYTFYDEPLRKIYYIDYDFINVFSPIEQLFTVTNSVTHSVTIHNTYGVITSDMLFMNCGSSLINYIITSTDNVVISSSDDVKIKLKPQLINFDNEQINTQLINKYIFNLTPSYLLYTFGLKINKTSNFSIITNVNKIIILNIKSIYIE